MRYAIDTEYTLTNASEPVGRLVCVSIAGPSGCGLFHANDPQAREICRLALAHGVAFANAPADITVIWRRWPDLLPEIIDAYENDRVVDVLTSEKLIDIAEGEHFRRGGYSLAAVARRRGGIELAKADTWRLYYEQLLPFPVASWPADARDYAIKDAAATFVVDCEQQTKRAYYRPFGFDLLEDAPRQARAHLALYMQSLYGIRTDPDQVGRVSARLDAEIANLSDECIRAGLARWKGVAVPVLSRNKKAAAAMLEDFAATTGQAVRRTEPTAGHPAGQVQLSEEALESLSLPAGHPLDAYRRLGAAQTQRTGWIGPLSHPGGRIYTRYDELVESGRTSSSGFDDDWRSPCSRNLQNFPQDGGYRECLVPDEGHALIGSDLGAAELVSLAQVQLDWFGQSALADAMRAGRDPHGEFAARLLAIDYADFDEAGNPEHKRLRKLAKPWNFGKPGGMGAKRFIAWARTQYGVVVSIEEERHYTKLWHQQWPQMRPYFDRVSAMEGPGGRITLVQPRSGRIRGGMRFPDACNTNFQGLAADGAKEGLWRLFVATLTPSSALFGARQLLFVHDENVTQARLERAQEARAEQDRIMIAAFARWCPDVPVKVKSTITDCYQKD
jgi:hypothetical protein